MVNGVIYSHHHISAYNLLLLQIPEYYTMSSEVFPTNLDTNFEKIDTEFTSKKVNRFAYYTLENAS